MRSAAYLALALAGIAAWGAGRPCRAEPDGSIPRGPARVAQASASSSTVDGNGKPIWFDVKSGFAKAKQLHRPIIADFYTDWCHWCRRLDRDTLNSEAVRPELRRMVCVKVNAEDGGDGQALAKLYRVNSFPSLLFFYSNGKPLGVVRGYRTPDELSPALKMVLERSSPKK